MLNKNKVGKPYSFSNMLMVAAFVVKYVFKIGYRGAADGTEGVHNSRLNRS